jgi:hypothetical protein
MINRSFAQGLAFDQDDEDLAAARRQTVPGGEPRTGQLTGTKALMLAVFEDGIRSYLGTAKLAARDAEYWIFSPRRHSPFSFAVVCEILGLDPDAVRETVKKMKHDSRGGRRALPRARHNVRIPGRVHARRT